MPPPSPSPILTPRRRGGRPARVTVTAALSATLSVALLAATLTAPASLAHPADPGPTVPGPSARPAGPGTARTGGGGARPRAPAGDLASLRAEASRLRATLEGQHRRLEVLAEDLEAAYARGVELLADASRLDRRRRAAERELAGAQAELDERARSSYIAGPGWFVSGLVGADDPADALARLPLQRAVLEADLALVDQVARSRPGSTGPAPASRPTWSTRPGGPSGSTPSGPRPSAWPQRSDASCAPWTVGWPPSSTRRGAVRRPASEPPSPTTWPGPGGRGGPAGRRAGVGGGPQGGRGGPGPARVPLRMGRRGPGHLRLLGPDQLRLRRRGDHDPARLGAQFAAYAGLRPVDPLHLIPGDLVFFADNPGNPSTIHHVGMYIGKGLMAEAPHTGAVVRTSSIWRPSYAGPSAPPPER